ncbi:MAG: GTPase domain-containing protein [Planctomycetes bacterium]|nr:GTPase domain-containing protein [Planctomycetota bacterium]
MPTPRLDFEPLRRKVLERLESLAAALAAARVPAWADADGKAGAALGEARKRLDDHIRFRLGRGIAAPAVVVLYGGTGVGKSTILNTLAGRAVTETSVRRPCTTEPLLYHHRTASPVLEAPEFLPSYTKKAATPGQPKAGTMAVELLAHEDAALASVVLVDAPDYDSVERENRKVAEDLYRVADLLIFVVNPAKYADEETWKGIRRAKADGKACAFVFNRAEPDDPALADFRRLLEGSEVVELPRDPAAHGAGLLADPAARGRLEEILKKFLLGDAADRLRLAELRRSWRALSDVLDDPVLLALRAAAVALRSGRAASGAEAKTADKALVEEVKLDQANDLERVSQAVRENLFSVVGFLSKKVIGPLTSLFDRVTGSLGRALSKNKPAIENALARVHENNRQAVRKHLGMAHERLTMTLGGTPAGAALTATKEFSASLMPASEIEDRYEKGLEAFEAWKKEQFQQLVGDIRGKKSIQLFVMQVLYVSLSVTFMAHTGGAFTLVEGLAAGPLFVFLDKVFVGAINWDLVRDLEKRGRDRFLQIFSDIAKAQGTRWAAAIAKEDAGLAGLPGFEIDLEELRRDVPALLDALEKP